MLGQGGTPVNFEVARPLQGLYTVTSAIWRCRGQQHVLEPLWSSYTGLYSQNPTQHGDTNPLFQVIERMLGQGGTAVNFEVARPLGAHRFWCQPNVWMQVP